ncbi:hypothetical protein LCGC14_2240260 [marine sediment metagenome]|uniref:YqaJ viral recombinase domain-containing protein n=1 Tax=marine sediment metagenome TaxID=412755 RepID=A0A0F9D5D1_9ZZZZ
MPITPAQLEARKAHIGGSDVAALLGIDPWQTAHDVWLSKTGRLDDAPATSAMQAGTLFEDGVLAWAAGELGSVVRNQYRSAPALHLGTNIDAVTADGEPVEGKTAGLFGPISEPWGDGRDAVPDRVIAQAHAHMLVLQEKSNPKRCWVPTFLGGRGFRMYCVDWCQELADVIAKRCVGFWEQVVQDTPPPGTAPSLAVIKRARREPGKSVAVEGMTAARYLHMKQAFDDAKKGKEQAEALLLAEMADAETGVTETLGVFTYRLQHRKGYTAKASSYRVLRHKGPKQEKLTNGQSEQQPADGCSPSPGQEHTADLSRADGAGPGERAAQAHDAGAGG